jgi:hypothetical protein
MLQRVKFILHREGVRIIALAILREMTTFGVNERHLTLNKATNSNVKPKSSSQSMDEGQGLSALV